MKANDFIFYFNKDQGSVPAKVISVNKRTGRAKIDGNFHETPNVRTVKIDNCQLQSEWLEEQVI